MNVTPLPAIGADGGSETPGTGTPVRRWLSDEKRSSLGRQNTDVCPLFFVTAFTALALAVLTTTGLAATSLFGAGMISFLISTSSLSVPLSGFGGLFLPFARPRCRADQCSVKIYYFFF